MLLAACDRPQTPAGGEEASSGDGAPAPDASSPVLTETAEPAKVSAAPVPLMPVSSVPFTGASRASEGDPSVLTDMSLTSASVARQRSTQDLIPAPAASPAQPMPGDVDRERFVVPDKRPAANLELLVDVLASMGSPNKLPLLKKVTARYEITPVGSAARLTVPLRCQQPPPETEQAPGAGEIAFVRQRYTLPDEDTSRLIEGPVRTGNALAAITEAPEDVRFDAGARSDPTTRPDAAQCGRPESQSAPGLPRTIPLT